MFLVGLRIVAKLSRKGHAHPFRVFKIAMVTSSASIDEACPLKVSNEFSDFTRQGMRFISA